MIEFRRFLLSLVLLFGFSLSIIAQVITCKPEKLSKNSSPLLAEVSGIIPSSKYMGHFWVHNDSGDKGTIYLIDTLCHVKSQFTLEGIEAVDIEDVAWLNIAGKPYILLGDIGNNKREREVMSFYLFAEPDTISPQVKILIPKGSIKTIRFKYGDKRRDAEAFFVDPIDNSVYIISKRDFQSEVFTFKLPKQTDKVLVLYAEAQLPFTFVTSADIARDGSKILVKNLTSIYQWNRVPGMQLMDTFRKEPKAIPYVIEPQGEAIAYDQNYMYFYTLSERALGLGTYLYKYQCIE